MPTINLALVSEVHGHAPSDVSGVAAALQRPAARDFNPARQARRATADDEQARRERAERLREEIEGLTSGRSRPAPKSPREFVEWQAGEEQGAAEEDAEHPPRGEGGE